MKLLKHNAKMEKTPDFERAYMLLYENDFSSYADFNYLPRYCISTIYHLATYLSKQGIRITVSQEFFKFDSRIDHQYLNYTSLVTLQY